MLQQTGKQVSYAHNTINDQEKVKIDLKEATIDEVLTLALRGKNIRWILSDNYISLSANKSTNPDSKTIAPADTIPQHTISGLVTDTFGIPLPGATVLVRGSSQGTATDGNGRFILRNIKPNAVLEVGYTGYEKRITAVEGRSEITLILLPAVTELSNVEVFSTGYQNIPKERATGSFVQIDNKLFNRRVSTNVLDRLDGVTPGLIFNRNTQGGPQNQSAIAIRGRSTIFANPDPLIILDNFPYTGDINNINPNDIESITVLKDAAAASIWGAYSGNGVIVITSKKGKYSEKLSVSVNSNITVGEKIDPFYTPRMSSIDFIEVERFLFEQGAYNATLNNVSSYISPAVDVMFKNRQGLISDDEMEAQLRALGTGDFRSDQLKYALRNAINQQYNIGIRGGAMNNQYFLSIGYDKNLSGIRYNNMDRVTINGNNTYSLLNKRIEFTTGFILSKSKSNAAPMASGIIGYEKLADENGNFLSIGGNSLRQSYIDTAGSGLLLDWNNRPLDEMRLADNVTDINDIRVNSGLKFKITSDLEINALYQYAKGTTENNVYYNTETFTARNLINTYSQINRQTGIVSYKIPNSGILDYNSASYESQNVRGTINYNKSIKGRHNITGLAGFDISKKITLYAPANRLYGYDKNFETAAPVDFSAFFPLYYSAFGTSQIPNNPFGIVRRRITDNNISYFANIGYNYDNRYTLTISARKDESNIFGVNINNKGVPLWSIGGLWQISNEAFYNISFLPYLRARITNGYNGNVDRTLSSFVTASNTIGYINSYNAPGLIVLNPPNPELRWEKINVTNFGVDFGSKGGVIAGSLEYFTKKGVDLIGNAPFAPSTGITQFKGNTSRLNTTGLDIVLNTKNVNRKLVWTTNFILSIAKDKVIDYKVKENNVSFYVGGSTTLYPFEGRPLYSLFSYKWGGVDPETGDPMGYLDGELTKDYTKLLTSPNLDELIFHGPSNPTIFGSVRNTFSLFGFELSANIMYKFGHYFRRTSLDYTSLFQLNSANAIYNPDYTKRWMKKGDESYTSVPSIEYPRNPNRASFYNGSEILAEKGDHIRLQDIHLSYNIALPASLELKINSVRIYGYVNNIGVLWRANRLGIDPDFAPRLNSGNVYPNVRSYAIGLNVGF
ncbi:SusC/RagA family TonB-linked outer membrane protein [Chitinophaga cymbidii]|uniref:SusC/RagA family TonB-linked outer membrane protein n=2 Tax=Chitinophaga cymbidii TaxID=1096750 RepID=A0A512RFP4_9BACT|nr:SusC/RagA family TonB-linked outer membrane protein [Chitinophaga cymbidii]